MKIAQLTNDLYESADEYMTKTMAKNRENMQKFLTAEAFNKKRDKIIQLLATQMSANAVNELGLICVDDDNSPEDIKFTMELAAKTLKSLGMQHIQMHMSETEPYMFGYVDELPPEPAWKNPKPHVGFSYYKRKWEVTGEFKQAGDMGTSRIAGTAAEKAIDALIKKTKLLQAKVKEAKGQS